MLIFQFVGFLELLSVQWILRLNGLVPNGGH